MVEFGSFILFMALLGAAIYQVISLRLRLAKAISALAQEKADVLVLSKKLGEALAEKSLSDNEGFVKFLNTSRDWAFEYIEAVQSKIVNLKDAMDSGSDPDIKLAYEDLIGMIPESKDTK